MQPRLKRKKIIWSAVGVFVFIVGLVVGSFLVLRSETSEGALFDIQNPTLSSYSSVQASNFLEDLKKFQEQNPAASGDNLTKRFLDAVAQAGTEQGLAAKEFSNPEFLYATVLPYLAELGVDILPEVADSEIRVSVKADEQEYISETRQYLVLVVGAWQKILRADPAETGEQEELGKVVTLLSLVDQELRNADVPVKYRQTHRELIQLNAAVQSIIRDGIIGRQEDPIRALLTISTLDTVFEFAQNLVFEIDRLEKDL